MRPPFSRKLRLIYLGICMVIFVVAIPILVLYASGYRLGKNFTLVKTGALFIRAESGARLTINADVHELGAFANSFFIQNLTPGMYEVIVEKEGYLPWRKNITVAEGLVSESAAFLFPDKIAVESVAAAPRGASSGGVSEAYRDIVELFESGDAAETADEPYTAVFGDVGIWHTDGVVYAKWLRGKRTIPSAFCIYTICRTTFPIFTSTSTITHIAFYPGGADAVLIGTTQGIFAAEIDKTPTHHRYTVYEGKDVDFRVDPDDRRIFIKDGASFKVIAF